MNLYPPRSWRVDSADIDFKFSSLISFFCAVIPGNLAAGMGAERAKQIYFFTEKATFDVAKQQANIDL